MLSALAPTTEMAIAALPLVLLPMVMLGGVLQPLNRMSDSVQALCAAVPTRWAFEEMLLLESYQRPLYSGGPVLGVVIPRGDDSDDSERSGAQDMAERLFPKETHRSGTSRCLFALAVLILLPVAGIHAILKLRDLR
jgi:hypothetical protein